MSSFPKFTIKEMLECGVHFGHKRMLWNPKMAPYIYCERNGVHIINLQKTAELLHNALWVLYQTIRKNPKAKILFVGTKHQASDSLKKYAVSSGQFFVNHRWLGGMLTNWGTVSKSIQKLSEYEALLADAMSGAVKYSKKELLDIDKAREKLERSLGGIREMRNKPDIIFVIDTSKEKIAIQEAKKLGIPVMAILDTNSNVDGIDYPIPGNDDSSKSIEFYCNIISKAILAGLEDSLVDSGLDPNEAKDRVREAIDKDIKKAEEKKIDFVKVQDEKEKMEATKISKKRIIEVSADSKSEVPVKNSVVKKTVVKAGQEEVSAEKIGEMTATQSDSEVKETATKKAATSKKKSASTKSSEGKKK